MEFSFFYSAVLMISALCIFQVTENKALERFTVDERFHTVIRHHNPVECRSESTGDAPTFPEDDDGPRRTTLRNGQLTSAEPLPCPDGKTYCASTGDYPRNQIKQMLKKQPKIILDQLYVEVIKSPTDRGGAADSSEHHLCPSRPRIVYPDRVQSKAGVFQFVVNDDEHKQGVKVEECTSQGACSFPFNANALGYSSSCEQKYVQRTLVVVNTNSTEVEGFVTKPFEFPSCCSCRMYLDVRGIMQSADRFGNRPALTTPKSTVKG